MSSLSKSKAKASGCEIFLTHKPEIDLEFWITKGGTEFHDYRSAYVEHLFENGLKEDKPWATSWLAKAGVSDEGFRQVRRDIDWFNLWNPDLVYGTEVFIAVDEYFEHLPDVENPGVGKSPEDSFAHGTIDLILKDGATVYADDYKTGFNTTPYDYEAKHYAVLLFAKFPDAEVVKFRWLYTRFGIIEPREFQRADLYMLQAEVENKKTFVDGIIERGDPKPNPFSGLCGFCDLDCPVRRMHANGEFPSPPIQTDEDFKKVYGYMRSFESKAAGMRNMVRAYLEAKGEVPVDDSNRRARVVPKTSETLPLAPVMRAMGFDVPNRLDEWDLDLDQITISSSLKSKLETKKRQELREKVAPAMGEEIRRVVEVTEAEE